MDDYSSLLGSILGAGGKSAFDSLNLGSGMEAFGDVDSVLAEATKALSSGGSLDPSQASKLGNVLGQMSSGGGGFVGNPNQGVLPPSGIMFTGGRPYPPNHYAAAIQGIGPLVGEVVKLIATYAV